MPHPTPSDLHALFNNLSSSGTRSKFFDRVADDVDWTITGTNALSGHYASKKEFVDKALGTVNGVLENPQGLELRVLNIVAGEEGEWAAVELRADQRARNGMQYNQEYVWMCRFDQRGMIVQVRAYYNGNLLNQVLEQNA
ncbi:hypothetical protein LTR66_004994 [Elasticomyces elasticus]|nr:hypothetical protein LTR50_004524 [Elasticomyces elasticus]KAK4995115.1 hypothetical protein LTR66_004994 [Elasticomyces elasticus]